MTPPSTGTNGQLEQDGNWNVNSNKSRLAGGTVGLSDRSLLPVSRRARRSTVAISWNAQSTSDSLTG
jgi:hypothetical protein